MKQIDLTKYEAVLAYAYNCEAITYDEYLDKAQYSFINCCFLCNKIFVTTNFKIDPFNITEL